MSTPSAVMGDTFDVLKELERQWVLLQTELGGRKELIMSVKDYEDFYHLIRLMHRHLNSILKESE